MVDMLHVLQVLCLRIDFEGSSDLRVEGKAMTSLTIHQRRNESV